MTRFITLLKCLGIAFLTSLLATNTMAGEVKVQVFPDSNSNGIPDELSEFSLALFQSPPRVYLLESSSGPIYKGRILSIDANGEARFDNVPDGDYTIAIEYPTPWVTPLTTAQEYQFSIGAGNQLETANFGFAVGFFDGIVLPPECLSTQQSHVLLDGRTPDGCLCDHLRFVRVESCCGTVLSPATAVLHTNVTNISALWSTGETNLTAMLPDGEHFITITDLDTGCVSSNQVLVSSSRPEVALRQTPTLISGANCGTNGAVFILDDLNGFLPPGEADLATITDLATGLPVPFVSTTLSPLFLPGVYFSGLPAGRFRIDLPTFVLPCDFEFIVEVPAISTNRTEVKSVAVPGGTNVVTTPSICNPIQAPPWVSVSTTVSTNGDVSAVLTTAANTGAEPRRADFMVGSTRSILVQPGSRPMVLEITDTSIPRSSGAPIVDIFAELGRPYLIETTDHITGPWQVEARYADGETNDTHLLNSIITQRFYRLSWDP